MSLWNTIIKWDKLQNKIISKTIVNSKTYPIGKSGMPIEKRRMISINTGLGLGSVASEFFDDVEEEAEDDGDDGGQHHTA